MLNGRAATLDNWGKLVLGYLVGMWLLAIVSGVVILVPTRQPLDFQLALLIVTAPFSIPALLAWAFADWTSGTTDHWPFLVFLLAFSLSWLIGYGAVCLWSRWHAARSVT